MSDRERLRAAKTLVVKVGSSLLASLAGGLDTAFIAGLAGQLAALRADGRRLVLVSSGAVAAGVAELGLPRRPDDLALVQAAAAVGQGALMQVYRTVLGLYGLRAGQMLLTRDGLANRRRFLHARNTLIELLERDVLPIVNENDVVAVEELKMGDNDALAVSVAQLADADALVIFSDVPGLYDRPPAEKGATLIPEVFELTSALFDAAGGSISGVGTGGMRSKLDAARAARAAGIPLVVADGRAPRALEAIAAGGEVGTVFWPAGRRASAYRQWIAFGHPPDGAVFVDDGAARALRGHGRSLLPIGVTRVDGDFDVGDTVRVADAAGSEFARGMVNLSADEIRRVKGSRSDQIAEALGRVCAATVIHRDNLVMLEGTGSGDHGK